MKGIGRFWLAAALAPLSAPALFVIATLYDGTSSAPLLVGFLVTIAAVSYVGFLVFGLPFVLLLRAKGKLTYVALLLGGIVTGPLFMIFLRVLSGKPVTFHGGDAVLSVTVAIVFGLIAKARIS